MTSFRSPALLGKGSRRLAIPIGNRHRGRNLLLIQAELALGPIREQETIFSQGDQFRGGTSLPGVNQRSIYNTERAVSIFTRITCEFRLTYRDGSVDVPGYFQIPLQPLSARLIRTGLDQPVQGVQVKPVGSAVANLTSFSLWCLGFCRRQ